MYAINALVEEMDRPLVIRDGKRAYFLRDSKNVRAFVDTHPNVQEKTTWRITPRKIDDSFLLSVEAVKRRPSKGVTRYLLATDDVTSIGDVDKSFITRGVRSARRAVYAGQAVDLEVFSGFAKAFLGTNEPEQSVKARQIQAFIAAGHWGVAGGTGLTASGLYGPKLPDLPTAPEAPVPPRPSRPSPSAPVEKESGKS